MSNHLNAPAPKTPDFASMEITSMGKRKFIDRGFLVICVATSLISIVILAILLTSIVVKAIPAFGPHSDNFKNDNRMMLIQGANSGNNPEVVDAGDIVQGIFATTELDRGGLGDKNNTRFDGAQRVIGIYSFEIVQGNQDNIFNLAPAANDQNVVALAKSMGLDASKVSDLPSSTTMMLLKHPNLPEFDLTKLKVESSLLDGEVIAGDTSGDEGWELDFACNMSGDHDFATLDLSPVLSRRTKKISNLMTDVEGVKNSKRGGYFSGLFSISSSDTESTFKPVKLRGENEAIVGSDLKIDDTNLKGLSRRKKNGFDFGGELNLIYCPLPETDASTLGHAVHFVSETNKTVPSETGIGPALMGTLWVCLGCGLFALPLGIGTAILLEEFKPVNRFLRWLHTLVQINITNLAGVPSIVYGILGLTAFSMMFGLLGSEEDPYFEVGAEHFFQYLTEADRPVLIPVESSRQQIAKQIEDVAKDQKDLLVGTRVGENELGESIYEVDLTGAGPQLKKLIGVVAELVAEIDNEIVSEEYERPQKQFREMEELLASGSPDVEAISELSLSLESRLLQLGEAIKQPVLIDGMAAQFPDGKKVALKILSDEDEKPTDAETLAVTLRHDAVGGPISQKRWFYFQLPFGRSVLAASLTLMLVILPVIIIASQEALRAVPPSLRECALGLGATPWQVVRRVTLPSAIPSIMTGAILSMSRANGEAAPILIICGILFVSAGPSHLMDVFSILPIQIFNTTKLPVNEQMMINTQNVAAAGIVVLLAILLTFNGIAIAIRQMTQKPLS